MRRRGLLALPAALALPALVPAAHAADVASLRAPLPDARVTDHRGRRRRLVSEVIGARVVAVDFVLTGCAALCQVLSAAMAEAQAGLGARIGPHGAGLVSIGLDPIGDTPAELARYAARFGAGPGWDFLSVPHQPLEQVVRRLGGPEPGADHAPMVLVLDAGRGLLRRLPGIPDPELIVAALDAALAARRTA